MVAAAAFVLFKQRADIQRLKVAALPRAGFREGVTDPVAQLLVDPVSNWYAKAVLAAMENLTGNETGIMSRDFAIV